MNTKAISQYDYFSTKGTRVTTLGVLKEASAIFDLFDVFAFAANENATDEPLPMQLGPLTPISGLAAVIIKEHQENFNNLLDFNLNQEMLLAKSKGIEAVRTLISFRRHMDEFTWDLMEISKETAKKLLLNEFTTFEELENFDFDSIKSEEIEVLYRATINTSKNESEYIIKTIFLDE